jgi:hypothetical protein
MGWKMQGHYLRWKGISGRLLKPTWGNCLKQKGPTRNKGQLLGLSNLDMKTPSFFMLWLLIIKEEILLVNCKMMRTNG